MRILHSAVLDSTIDGLIFFFLHWSTILSLSEIRSQWGMYRRIVSARNRQFKQLWYVIQRFDVMSLTHRLKSKRIQSLKNSYEC